MASKVLLLADDLTGACDAAVHFARGGLRASVAVSLECVRDDLPVWAVNTESRELGRDEIERLMAKAGASLPAGPQTVIFKKIDSTLRGNAGLETAAAMRAFGCETAVFTPALPALGRTVQNGVLRVAGSPDFEPIEIAVWLQAQGLHGCTNITAVDAVCDADLDRTVAETLASKRRILWVGSAGLAAALARAICCESPCIPSRNNWAAKSSAVVFAIGSTHPVTLAQLEVLRLTRGQHRVLPVPRGAISEAAIQSSLGPALPGALVLSGGDTASVVCRALGAERIDLEDEIVAGIPWGILRGGVADGIPVATKSGGFGAPDALVRVLKFFQNPEM